MFVALLELEVERDFAEIWRWSERWSLLNVPDAVVLVDLLKIDQLNSLAGVDIQKEDLVSHTVCCNRVREVDWVKAMW